MRIGNRIAQGVTGERDESVGEIGTVHAEFENLRTGGTRSIQDLVDEGKTFELKRFFSDVPRYAILSHTWGVDEPTFDDLATGTAHPK